jgi:hypothetical protein
VLQRKNQHGGVRSEVGLHARVGVLPSETLEAPVVLYGAEQRIMCVERVVGGAAQFEGERGA